PRVGFEPTTRRLTGGWDASPKIAETPLFLVLYRLSNPFASVCVDVLPCAKTRGISAVRRGGAEDARKVPRDEAAGPPPCGHPAARHLWHPPPTACRPPSPTRPRHPRRSPGRTRRP